MEVLLASFRNSTGRRVITGHGSDGNPLNIPFLMEPIVRIALGWRVSGAAFEPSTCNVVKVIVVFGHAFHFALDICNIQSPLFTGLPAMMQNLPFAGQPKHTPEIRRYEKLCKSRSRAFSRS